MDFYRLIEEFHKYYYTSLLMFIVELAALIIGLLYVRKERSGQFFIAYIAFDLCILLAGWYFRMATSISREFISQFLNFTNTFVAYVELLVYFYFFRKILESFNIKKILTGLTILYSLLLIIFITTKFSFITNRYGYVASIIGATEFVFLLIPCIYYFFQLLNTKSSMQLSERPTFWIVTGIFFYCFISVPFYIIDRYLINTNPEFLGILGAAFYYIPFTANFVFLIKAFLCKKPLTI